MLWLYFYLKIYYTVIDLSKHFYSKIMSKFILPFGKISKKDVGIAGGKGASLGAGTTLTKDAPGGALTISRAKQVTVPGWRRPVKKK